MTLSKRRSSSSRRVFDYPTKERRFREIEELQSAPEFWTNAERAQKFVTEMNDVRSIVAPIRKVTTAYEELAILADMAKEAGDDAVIDEFALAIAAAASDAVRTLESGTNGG